MGWYPYKVTYAIDSTDSNPCVEYFGTEDSAIDWRNEEVERRVDYRVQHSPYSISEQEREHMVEQEMSLTKITKIERGV
tara:strand:+ start:387 stop:623 length:237 start_codon:yes stop_codon:yes gene_type:complete